MTESASYLKELLFSRVYKIKSMIRATEPARQIVANLYTYLCAHPKVMPDNFMETSQIIVVSAAVDYIAGMSDHYDLELAKKLNLIRSL